MEKGQMGSLKKMSEFYGFSGIVRTRRNGYKIINSIKRLGINFPLVLDVGCSIGTITKVVRENLRHSIVTGIDISKEKINIANKDIIRNLNYYSEDFLDIYEDNLSSHERYNLILLNFFISKYFNYDLFSLKKSYESLNKEGWICVTELICPDDEIFEEYRYIFLKNESRNYYRKLDLILMIRKIGFENVRSITYSHFFNLLDLINSNSENWTKEKKEYIYSLFMNSSKKFKEFFNIVPLMGGDYLLRGKMSVIVGQKKT